MKHLSVSVSVACMCTLILVIHNYGTQQIIIQADGLTLLPPIPYNLDNDRFRNESKTMQVYFHLFVHLLYEHELSLHNHSYIAKTFYEGVKFQLRANFIYAESRIFWSQVVNSRLMRLYIHV